MVATASRDQLVKVYDIRAMKEFATLRGHKKEVCCESRLLIMSSVLSHGLERGLLVRVYSPYCHLAAVAWHPIHQDLLVSGGSEGSIIHWSLPDPAPKESLEFAHDSNVWSLAYHPLGHLLVSASNDHTTRFWSRSRPGMRNKGDRFHVGKERAEMGDDDEDDRRGGGGGMGPPGFLPGLQHQQRGFAGAMPNFGRGGSGPGGGDGERPPLPGMGMGGPPPGMGGPPPGMGGGGGGGMLPGMGMGRAPVPPPPGMGMGGPGASIPGFGRAPQHAQSPPGYGAYDGPQQQGGRAPLPPGYGDFGGGPGGGGGGGMRRNGPLPSQQESLDRYAGGGGGGGGHGRWGGGGGGGRY